MTDYPAQVNIVEVGPRDGLQNESASISVDTRIELVERLVACGLQQIEAGSFVAPRWVPQMAASDQVFAGIRRQPTVRYTALVPNLQGLQRALQQKVSEVAVFAAATESFSQRNINCSIEQSLDRFAPVCEAALAAGVPVRAYVSCVIDCPYEGAVSSARVLELCHRLSALGCHQISLGDTIGSGTPRRVEALLVHCLQDFPAEQLAVHFHDTYGQALANILMALQLGIHTIDCSVAGLGGCPYARGASGNVATEDVIYMLHGMGIGTGVDLAALIDVSRWISQCLEQAPRSRLAQVFT